MYRVANNLSDRISRDIEQFFLSYEPEAEAVKPKAIEEEKEIMGPEPPQEITFREEGFIMIASLDEDLSQLDFAGQTEHYQRMRN